MRIASPLRMIAAVAGLTLAMVAAPAAVRPAEAALNGFVSASGGQFMLNGEPFRFGGTNNYYMHYKSQLMVDDVLNDAAAMGLDVIRVWTFLECGGDQPNSAGGCSQGESRWMQRWSDAAGGPVYNTGQNGLQKLDYLLAQANEVGIRVIMTLTNNWPDFGGMDQYVTWYGLQFHDQFYTDQRIRQDYKDWVSTLVNRTNSITGVQYRNDPAIFSWELANEPRCINASLPSSGNCTQETITEWADEMSSYIKSIDPNHMVSVGSEGFLDWGRAGDWPYNGTDGVDHEALASLPNVDFGTFHLYPDHWTRDPQWGTQWIEDHMAAAQDYGKPVILEEFGLRNQGTRDSTYQTWTDAVRTGGGDGFNFWILTGIRDDGSLYPNYDGFRVVYPSDTATVLSNAAAAMSGEPAPDPDPDPDPDPEPDPDAACEVDYAIQNDWGSGFTGQIVITNTGSATNGWELAFTFPGEQQVTNGWKGNWSQADANVTVGNMSWNAGLGAGETVTVGFNASYTGTNEEPTAFTLNGVDCAVI